MFRNANAVAIFLLLTISTIFVSCQNDPVSINDNQVASATDTLTGSARLRDPASDSVFIEDYERIPQTLESGRVSPGSGQVDATYAYLVQYFDPDSLAPKTYDVIIDGVRHQMELKTGTIATGATYSFDSQLLKGSHSYYFEFTNESDSSFRFPVAAYQVGPMVTPVGVDVIPGIILIDDLDSVALVSIIGSKYSFSYTGVPPNISIGAVLIGLDTTNGQSGYLRQVSSVTIGSDIIEIETDHITLDKVVKNAQYDTTITFGLGSQSSSGQQMGMFKPTYLAPGVSVNDGGLDLSGLVLFEGTVTYEGLATSLSATITNGRITFQPDIDMGIDIGFFKLNKFHTIISSELEFPCDIKLVASGGFSKKGSISIAKFSYYHLYPIGAPVLVKYTLEFVAGYSTSADIEGSMSFGYEYSNSIKAGARYTDGTWELITDASPQYTGHEPTYDVAATASAKVYVKPIFRAEIYSTAGPMIEIDPYIKFDAKATPDPACWKWSLVSGLDGNLAFEASILGIELTALKATLFSNQNVLAADSACSDVHSLKIYPQSNQVLYLDQSVQMSVQALDSLQNVLDIDANRFTWTNSNPEALTLSPNVGNETNAHAIKVGLAEVTVVDTESGITATASINIIRPIKTYPFNGFWIPQGGNPFTDKIFISQDAGGLIIPRELGFPEEPGPYFLPFTSGSFSVIFYKPLPTCVEDTYSSGYSITYGGSVSGDNLVLGYYGELTFNDKDCSDVTPRETGWTIHLVRF